MCDLESVSAGSLRRPVITVQPDCHEPPRLETRGDQLNSQELRPRIDGDRVIIKRPSASSSSSREDADLLKQDANSFSVEGSPRRRVSFESAYNHGILSRDVRARGIVNDTAGGSVYVGQRSQSMHYPVKPKISIKRSATIELANAWASDTELESGLESDTSSTRLSPNPSPRKDHSDWPSVTQSDGPDNIGSQSQADHGVREVFLSSSTNVNSMICSIEQESDSRRGATPVSEDLRREPVTSEGDSSSAGGRKGLEEEEKPPHLHSTSRNVSSSSIGREKWNVIRRAVRSWSPFVQVYRRKYPWVQLAGHQGNFLPADGGRIRKKACDRELLALSALMKDNLKPFVPQFFQQVEVDDEQYLEMEDLLAEFDSPAVMDIKMGVRTYLEEELTKARKSPAYRKDLYEKMIAVDPNEPTEEEHARQGVTKPRYMQFRENASSSSLLGFRIEGIKLPIEDPRSDFKKVRRREDVAEELRFFLAGKMELWTLFLDRLKALRAACETSDFFYQHEIIGSSLLFVGQHSTNLCGVWVIDFGKTSRLPNGQKLNHRKAWAEGNREDGYLWGLDNLIDIWSNLYIEEDSKAMKETSSSSHDIPAAAVAKDSTEPGNPPDQSSGATLSPTSDGPQRKRRISSSTSRRRGMEVSSAGYSTEV